MINKKLLHPESIVIIGASNNISKPGGKIVKNLIDNKFKGHLYAINPKYANVQGIATFKTVEELPDTDLAVLAIPAQYCLNAVITLAEKKNTKVPRIHNG